MKRYSTLFFKDPVFVANIAAKVDAGEKVWLMEGKGKRARPVLVTSAYKYDEPDWSGAWGMLYLDHGPGGKWPRDQWPEWATRPVSETERTET